MPIRLHVLSFFFVSVSVCTFLLWPGGVWGAVWDKSCGNAIHELRNIQLRILEARGALLARDMQQHSASFVDKEDGIFLRSAGPSFSHPEQDLRSGLDQFNAKLNEFTQTCLQNPGEHSGGAIF